MRRAYDLELQKFIDDNGTLTVFEEGTIPFAPRRTFLVEASAGEMRGSHAHRLCRQLLVVISGEVQVRATDGTTFTNHQLTNRTPGLVIPAMIWASQEYIKPHSVLLVLCDQVFDEADYIRDFVDFISLARRT